MSSYRDRLPPLLEEMYPPPSKFRVEDIPDLTGKICIVTGGSAGVGRETVKALLTRNATVYIAARNEEKTRNVIQELKEQTRNEAKFLHLELDNLQSVRNAAEEFQKKEKQLHILFNNAGVMVPPIEQLTADGYDLQFGTNVLGHFLFTKLLIPTLLSTTRDIGTRKGDARVIHTSSSMHNTTSTIDFDTLVDGAERKKKGTRALYSQSKFGNVVLSNEFAHRYEQEGLISIVVNPGNLRSDLQRNVSGVQKALTNMILHPVQYGALTQLWGGTSEEGAKMNGQYLRPWARVGRARPETQDRDLGQRLWDWLEDQVKDI